MSPVEGRQAQISGSQTVQGSPKGLAWEGSLKAPLVILGTRSRRRSITRRDKSHAPFPLELCREDRVLADLTLSKAAGRTHYQKGHFLPAGEGGGGGVVNQQAKQHSGGETVRSGETVRVWMPTLPFAKGTSLGTGCPVPEPQCPHPDDIK